MLCGFEFMPLRHLFLQLLNLPVNYLDEPAASYADQMVMMLVGVFMLEAQDSVAKINFPAQARIGEKLHRPINGHETNLPMGFPYQLIQLLGRNVPFGLKEGCKYTPALGGISQPFGFNKFRKYLEFPFHLRNGLLKIIFNNNIKKIIYQVFLIL